MKILLILCTLAFGFLFGPILSLPGLLHAENFLEDTNDDNRIEVIGFGDSISYGVGDGTSPGDIIEFGPRTDGSLGYLQRLRENAGLVTRNLGVPGEFFTKNGIERFPNAVRSSSGDIVVILDGTNDARRVFPESHYRRALQQAVNITRALGKKIVLFTVLPTCCNREGGTAFTRVYSRSVREIAQINKVGLADIERAYASSCQDKAKCELLNRPEGLHPNTRGYDVVAQTLLATLAGINIFAPGGAAQLESAYGLPAGSVIVIPDEVQVQ